MTAEMVKKDDNSYSLASIEEIIEEARQGRMFILVDDEDRENEGDLVIPAEMASPEIVNFMATHGRGLICLPLTQDRVSELQLPLMSQNNGSRHSTAFTISIESKEGVTTGISAADRAQTIATAIDPSKSAQDIVSPGHIFPLAAKNGGVLVRAGHTEAAVDIARLAGMTPSGVICEIMNEDGTMARLPDLFPFAEKHNLKIASIADLISYRRRYDTLVERIQECELNSIHGGDFTMVVYKNTVEYAEHIALIKGDITPDQPVLVRMHALNILADALGDTHDSKQEELQRSMQIINEAGRGVIVLLREPRKNSLSDRLAGRLGGDSSSLRDYGIGAQILIDIGIKRMILMSNSQRDIVGLEGYGLSVEGYHAI